MSGRAVFLMARIKSTGFDDVIKELTSLDIDKMTDEMVKAAEPVMLESLRGHASKHKETGAMVSSIKSTGVKQNKLGKYLVVRPTGRDKNGVRNMEKMAYLEYGTYKQKATPVVTPAVKDVESRIEKQYQDIFDKYTKKVTI